MKITKQNTEFNPITLIARKAPSFRSGRMSSDAPRTENGVSAVTAQKPKQRDRILDVLAIEPRSVAMLESRTGIDRRRVNKILAELRATGNAYVFRYEVVDRKYIPIYAAGNTPDEPMPDSLKSRKEKFEETINARIKTVRNPYAKDPPAPFDPSKPVACYGIWGLA